MADTGSYFVAAYVAAGALYVGYGVSLFWRRRAVRARLRALGASNVGRATMDDPVERVTQERPTGRGRSA